ncbi:hypothetical protein [Oceanicoccus sp. KOV_DT_Chl]|uniref:hypothetical protein n=1 Tax=Oceanicoccus sp. KOV_DT_Chl TaxID=1904639 RepID=UPI000C7AE9C1|nr:hypothetical protein [Oceanicoccus sp. KOV_DT_Chl]
MFLKLLGFCTLSLIIALPAQSALRSITVQSKTVVNGTVEGSYISNNGSAIEYLTNGIFDSDQGTFNWESSVHRISYLTGLDILAEDAIIQSSFTMTLISPDSFASPPSQTINNCTEGNSTQLFVICPYLNIGTPTLMNVVGPIEFVTGGAYEQWIFRTREVYGNDTTFADSVFLISTSNCLDGEECGTPVNIESLSAVPLPGGLWLFLSAIFTLGGSKILRQH